MKRILLFLSLLYSVQLFSQPGLRYTRYYNLPPHYGAYTHDVTTTDFGYVLSGIVMDTANGYTYNRLTLLAVDSLGDSLWTRSYGSSGFQYTWPYTGKWMLKKNNNLFLSCPIVKPGDTVTSVLVKFNMNGDTVWQREYSDIQYQLAFENFNTTSDNGFIFTGYVTGGGSRSLFLMKTDSLGNELWRKKINTGTIGVEGRAVVYDFINQKYVICGLDTPSPNYKPRALVIITDSVGNKLSQFSFSGQYGGAHFSVIKSYDNNFVTCGINSTGIPISSFTKVRAQIIKFDISGNAIWSHEYGVPSIINSLSGLKELSDGSIIVGGEYDTLYNSGAGANSSFILRKLNENGDSLWMRSIDLTKNNTNQDVFTGMDITHDDGFVMTGYAFIDTALNKFELVKLDNFGCDSIGCQFTGVEEQKNLKREDISIYPNPANNQITIEFQTNAKDVFIEIKNTLSEIVYTERLQTFTPKTIDILAYSDGVYFMEVQSGNAKIMKKFVKQ